MLFHVMHLLAYLLPTFRSCLKHGVECAAAGVRQFAHRYHTGRTQCSVPPTSQLIIAVSVSQPE